MKQTIDNYRLTSMEGPTDEVLSQLMKEAAEEAQREDYMIMDDQYFSFEALSKIYSVKDVLRY